MSGETSVLAMEAEELRKKVPALEARIKELESFLGSLGFGNDAQAEVAQLRNLLAAQIAGRNEAETQLGERKAELEQLESRLRREILAHHDDAAKCAELRGIFEDLIGTEGPLPHIHKSYFPRIEHALSSDCGKGWIKVGEFVEQLVFNVKEAQRLCGYEAIAQAGIKLADHIQQLIERAKK